MQSILKKTLVASAVALAAANANAATIATVDTDTGTAGTQVQSISAQGLAALGYIQIGDATGDEDATAEITINANTQTTDFMLVTVSGGTISNTSTAGITLVLQSGTGPASITAIGLDTSTGVVTFRPATAITAGAVYAVQGVTVTGVTSSLAVAYTAEAAGTQFDQATATTIATVADQFSAAADTTNVLDRVVDVENERKQFVAVGSDIDTDSFGIDLKGRTVTDAAWLLEASVTTGSVALTGSDLAFLLDEDGDLESSNYAAAGFTAVTSGDDAPALSGNTFTVNASALTADEVGLTLNVDTAADDNAQVLEAQSFTADLGVSYSYNHTGSGTHAATTGSVSFSNIAVGSWTLSGAAKNIYFMPWGPAFAQTIHVTNDGTVTGDIEVSGFDDEGNSFGPVTLSVAATAGTVTSVAAAITEALVAEGFDGNGNVDLTLVINAPADDVEVFAAYRHIAGNDRISVPVEDVN